MHHRVSREVAGGSTDHGMMVARTAAAAAVLTAKGGLVVDEGGAGLEVDRGGVVSTGGFTFLFFLCRFMSII